MKVTVRTRDDATTFEAAEGERLLQAGLSRNVGLPHECATGTCGMCKARLDEGEVTPLWGAAPGGAALKPNKGQILLCQSAVKTDCTISINRGAELYGTAPDYVEASIVEVRPLTRDVARLKIAIPGPMVFEPGQFVTMEVPGIDGPRAYSLANSPQSHRLEFLIKRKPDGEMTGWIFERARPGDKIRIFGPLGRAHLRPDDKHLVLISGSSGLSSTLSILKSAAYRDRPKDFRTDIFFGVRTPSDIFCTEDFTEFLDQSDRVSVTICLSDAPAADQKIDNRIRLAKGFVHEVLAAHNLENSADTTAFIAGPPPMVDASIRVLVTDWRVPLSNIRYDKFN